MRSSLFLAGFFGLGLALAANAGWAQIAPQTTAPTNSRNIDQQLVSCLIIDNQSEIQLAEFASGRARRDDVKSFAKQMKNDHEKLVQQLKQVATVDARTGSQQTQGNDRTARGQKEQFIGGVPVGESSMLRLKKEVTDECLKALQTELGSKPASEFDRCYMAQQVGAHMHMLATLRVFERNASPELAPVIQESSQTVEGHLNHAKRILQGVESEVASARTTSTQRQ